MSCFPTLGENTHIAGVEKGGLGDIAWISGRIVR